MFMALAQAFVRGQIPSPDHPFPVLGLVARSFRGLLRVRLDTILGICLLLCLVRSGRALRGGFRLGDYDTISITRRRGERYKTKLFGATTSAFDVLG